MASQQRSARASTHQHVPVRTSTHAHAPTRTHKHLHVSARTRTYPHAACCVQHACCTHYAAAPPHPLHLATHSIPPAASAPHATLTMESRRSRRPAHGRHCSSPHASVEHRSRRFSTSWWLTAASTCSTPLPLLRLPPSMAAHQASWTIPIAFERTRWTSQLERWLIQVLAHRGAASSTETHPSIGCGSIICATLAKSRASSNHEDRATGRILYQRGCNRVDCRWKGRGVNMRVVSSRQLYFGTIFTIHYTVVT